MRISTSLPRLPSIHGCQIGPRVLEAEQPKGNREVGEGQGLAAQLKGTESGGDLAGGGGMSGDKAGVVEAS